MSICSHSGPLHPHCYPSLRVKLVPGAWGCWPPAQQKTRGTKRNRGRKHLFYPVATSRKGVRSLSFCPSPLFHDMFLHTLAYPGFLGPSSRTYKISGSISNGAHSIPARTFNSARRIPVMASKGEEFVRHLTIDTCIMYIWLLQLSLWGQNHLNM